MANNRNHNNDPIERLFQKKAEEYDIRFREKDWDSLEQKLDVRDAQIAYRRKAQWLAAASLMIISLLGYFTYENHNRLNQISEHLADDIPGEQIPPPVVQDFPGTQDEGAVRDEPGSGLQPVQEEESPAVFAAETLRTIEPAEAEITPFIPERSISGRFERELPIAAVTPETMRLPDAPSFQTIDMPTEFTGPVAASRSIYTSDSGFDFDSTPASLSGLSLGLVASPDLSTVGSVSNFHDPGYKIGIVAEYSISQNMSISTGIIQTMVRYSAGSDDYNPPVYWQGDIAPEQMIGECLLFDIPITLKYNFLNFDRSRFYATAGLSSYMMQNEDYYFSYGQELPGQMDSWSGRTGTRHWFSNAGFSIGYELDIHPNWSLRAEPFMKVPLKEVGWGNVNLYSMGSFVSLNYRL